MLVHTVYFWLKDERQGDGDLQNFRAGLETLADIECANAVHIGTPAATDPRPVIDTSYTFALTVLLDSLEDQAAYQVHPLHKKFVENFAPYWDKVLIYDAD
jgi:hypothetical protein